MIKIENVTLAGFEAAIRGMRNPKNSWDKSDSDFSTKIELGPNDMDLATRLAKGGPVHAKYRRMIQVWVDITAPLYWWPEMDAYRIGVTRNSCSFMHKGTSKEYKITDFSIKNEKVYEVLCDFEKNEYVLKYPYETDEYKLYTASNGRTYRVYRNGKVIQEAFDYVDSYGNGRKRFFPERDATVYQNDEGYYIVKFSGRYQKHECLHRLVAELWCEHPKGADQVNHIDGDKGNNSAENLEWVTASENMVKSFENGTHANVSSLHSKYKRWKNSCSVIPTSKRFEFRLDVERGLSINELSEKYGITPIQANNSRYVILHSENEELFNECYLWENLLNCLNSLREEYNETKDITVFKEIRALMPQGYLQKSTLMMNYEVLHNIYVSRQNHKLDEWHDFCDWVKTLPLSDLITMEEK